MHRRLTLVAGALVASLCAAAPNVQAQTSGAQPAPTTQADPVRDEKARQLFSAGVAAYSEGHYENALENYRLAFQMSDRPQLLFNIGIAAERLRRDQEALDAFNQYLERVPNADNRSFVEERIAILRQAIGSASEAPAPAPQAAPAAALAPTPSDESAESGSVLSKWWFWGIVGVAAVAVTATVIVVASSGEPDYQEGDVGGVVTTLTLP